MFRALLLLLYLIFAFGAENDLIKCPLIWERTSLGEVLPSTAVPTATYGNLHFIARAETQTGTYIGGRTKEGVGYFPENGLFKSMTTFEVLTNPHGCIVNWRRGSDGGNFGVVVSTSPNKYIGRSLIRSKGALLSGEISGSRISIAVNGAIESPSDFEILRSYSQGLNLFINKFVFKDPFPAGIDFLGVDEIDNRSPMTIKQTVLFRKSVLQRTDMTNSISWGHSFSVEFSIQPEVEVALGGEGAPSIGISGPTLELGYELNNAEKRGKGLASETEITVEVIREVTVQPYTSVQVCSTITMLDKFHFEYLAQGKYSGPGLSSQEVAEILAADGKTGFAQGDSIIVEEEGSFDGSMAMNTQFIVVPIDAPEGCSELSSKIVDYRTALSSGKLSRQQSINIVSDIHNMIKRISIL